MNISSAVVRTKPEHVKEVLLNLRSSDECDVYFHDKEGRIVVTIEGESVDEEVKKLRAIQNMEYVLSAELIYAYSDDELNKAEKYFEKMGRSIPDALNN